MSISRITRILGAAQQRSASLRAMVVTIVSLAWCWQVLVSEDPRIIHVEAQHRQRTDIAHP